MRKNIPKVSIKQGSFFAFNQTENTIYLAEKEPYFLSDLFRCLHEVGHYVDFHKHRRKTYNILFNLRIISIILYPITPCLLVYSLIKNDQPSYVLILSIALIVMDLIKLIFTHSIEQTASNFAYTQMENLNDDLTISLKRFGLLAIIDQILFILIMVFPIGFIAYIIYL